jgi:hypothetical protein
MALSIPISPVPTRTGWREVANLVEGMTLTRAFNVAFMELDWRSHWFKPW